MAFPLRRALRRTRGWMKARPQGTRGIIIPFFRPILKRRHVAEPAGPIVNLRAGDLEVRLATSSRDIDAAQALRYRVFYEEMAARPTPAMAVRQRDFDEFDTYCDHLLVLDHSRGSDDPAVVGTYRLIRRAAADRLGHFYSEDEYNIRKLLRGKQEVLELGRSCVDAAHRRQPTMQLLWRGISQYVTAYDISLMFGCASFHGVDPAAHALPLSYLHYNHLAPPEIRPKAVKDRYVSMALMPPGALDHKAAQAAMPPLIKGYLRLGAFIGDGAVVDTQFNTVDVCIVVKMDWVTDKYLQHYRRHDPSRRPRKIE